eukprot:403377429
MSSTITSEIQLDSMIRLSGAEQPLEQQKMMEYQLRTSQQSDQHEQNILTNNMSNYPNQATDSFQEYTPPTQFDQKFQTDELMMDINGVQVQEQINTSTSLMLDTGYQFVNDNDFASVDDQLPSYMRGQTSTNPEISNMIVEKTEQTHLSTQSQNLTLQQLQELIQTNPQLLQDLLMKMNNPSLTLNPTPSARPPSPSYICTIEPTSRIFYDQGSQSHFLKDQKSTQSQMSSQKSDESESVFEPSHLNYKANIADQEQLPLFHEQLSHSKLNKYADKYDLCQVHPKMKKNHLCTETQEHLCDTCIISDEHKDHTTAPLSKISLEIHKQFTSHFHQFENSMNAIDRIDAKNWKTTLRSNYLQLFDELFNSLDVIKNQKLRDINEIFTLINIKEVNHGLNEMQVSHDIAKKYTNLVNHMFDQNQYSAITKRQDQFTLVGQSMSQLTHDCNGLLDLAQSKRRKLDIMQNQMQSLVLKIKNETEEKLKSIVDEELIICDVQKLRDFTKTQEQESLELKKRKEARSGFYYFLKEQKPIIQTLQPNMKYLEIIAYLQTKWTSLNEEAKLTYEMMASDHERQLDQDQKKRLGLIPKNFDSDKEMKTPVKVSLQQDGFDQKSKRQIQSAPKESSDDSIFSNSDKDNSPLQSKPRKQNQPTSIQEQEKPKSLLGKRKLKEREGQQPDNLGTTEDEQTSSQEKKNDHQSQKPRQLHQESDKKTGKSAPIKKQQATPQNPPTKKTHQVTVKNLNKQPSNNINKI